MSISRRKFIGTGALFAAGLGGLRLNTLSLGAQSYKNEADGYGELVRDPDGLMDLPRGFSYRVLSRTGQRMDDGLFLPGAPDGMAAFASGREVVLVRNHELTPDLPLNGPFGANTELLETVDAERLYDSGGRRRPHLGGTTNLVYDPETGKVVRQFLSLGGTCRNCAGGPTPWNTWITCEETVERAGDGNDEDHGYNFEVNANARPELTRAVALKAMGRFNHEAVAVDPASGVVYQTEDRGDGLFYRFIPNTPGELARGGRLQALVVVDKDSADTRNWPLEIGKDDEGKTRYRAREGSELFPERRALPVRWVDIEEVESPGDDLRQQGFSKGAAVFARGEGAWQGNDSIYFACTNGGAEQCGQVFRYRPGPHEGTSREQEQPGTIELFVESKGRTLLEYCDNLTVAPWGDVVLSEDGPENQYIRGVRPDGRLYTIAHNRLNHSELTGVCFAPNHPTLFVNIQNPGITFAITGPWERPA